MTELNHHQLIIGLNGPAGSGKDTASEIMVRELTFYQEYFAKPIYRGLGAIFCMNPNHLLEDRTLKEFKIPGFDFTYRQALQKLGTEWRDEMGDKNLWVKLLVRRISHFDRVVITDVRFNHEAEWIKSQGGSIIKIEASFKGFKTTPSSSHSSEAGIDPKYIDLTIANNSTIAEFKNNILISTEKLIYNFELNQKEQHRHATESLSNKS